MNEEIADLEQLARRAVLARFRAVRVPNPAAVAAVGGELAESAAVGLTLAPATAVASICRGVLSGAQAVDADLPETAASLLGGVAGYSSTIDPSQLMTWAIDGMAAVRVDDATRSAIEDSLEGQFMGCGEAFFDACKRAAARA